MALTKAHVSMAREVETTNETDDDKPPKKQECLLDMESICKQSNEIEDD